MYKKYKKQPNKSAYLLKKPLYFCVVSMSRFMLSARNGLVTDNGSLFVG